MSGLQPPLRPSDAEIYTALSRLHLPAPRRPVIVALRRAEEPGDWNDLLGVLGPSLSLWIQGTTDPGSEPMVGKGRIPTNPAGVGRVKPGYYVGAFSPGYHHADAAHPCLRQAIPLPTERYDAAAGRWHDVGLVTGPFNLHRASFEGQAVHVGDYSHGCLVARDRREHWSLLLAAGYPEHGPSAAQQASMRWDLCLIDWSAYLAGGR